MRKIVKLLIGSALAFAGVWVLYLFSGDPCQPVILAIFNYNHILLEK
jgi:hypothetical protein